MIGNAITTSNCKSGFVHAMVIWMEMMGDAITNSNCKSGFGHFSDAITNLMN